MSSLIIYNGRVITEQKIIEDAFVKIEEGLITEVGSGNSGDIDAQGNYIAPGLIDLHTHGGLGVSVMEAGPECLEKLAAYKLSQGVTGFLATTVTASRGKLKKVCQTVADYMDSPESKANLWGVHLEGPYLNYWHRGAQEGSYLRKADSEEFMFWKQILASKLKILTLAPELRGAKQLIKLAREQGVIVAAGHSSATYEELQGALKAGLSHATHLFNGMVGFHHRRPGAVGALLTAPELSVDLIVDGQHLHQGALELALKIKNLEEIILITDSMEAAGLGDGSYKLGGLEVEVKKGVARLDSGALAGSLLSLNQALKNLISNTELGLVEGLKTVSINPARRLNLAEKKGSIKVAKDADLVLFDEQFNIKLTVLEGKIVYNNLF